jgi:uncharacterized protein
MPTTQAIVPTDKASRYLQQLCKHWSHKFEVTFDAERGHVPLPIGDARMTAGDDALTITLTIAEGGDMAKLQGVIASHLNRFAFREGELAYEWQDI